MSKQTTKVSTVSTVKTADVKISKAVRLKRVNELLAKLHNATELKEKKRIRRTLRSKFDYYISRQKKVATAVVE